MSGLAALLADGGPARALHLARRLRRRRRAATRSSTRAGPSATSTDCMTQTKPEFLTGSERRWTSPTRTARTSTPWPTASRDVGLPRTAASGTVLLWDGWGALARRRAARVLRRAERAGGNASTSDEEGRFSGAAARRRPRTCPASTPWTDPRARRAQRRAFDDAVVAAAPVAAGPSASSRTSARSRAASDRSTRSVMTDSTWVWAPESSMIRLQPREQDTVERGAEAPVEQPRVVGGRVVERERDQHRALALDQVVAGRLASGRGVAEHAEQVVAELERLAQRESVRREPGQRGVIGAGEGGSDVEGPLDGVLRRLVAQHGHRGLDVSRAARLHRDVEELARDHLGPAQVEQAHRGGDILQRQTRSDAAAPPTSSAAGRPAGSPRRRRTARGRRASRSARCSASNPRCVAGRPRRVSEASIRSSWTSALACSSSRAAHARSSDCSSWGRRRHGSESPVAEGSAEPLAPADAGPRLGEQAGSVRDRAEPAGPPSRRGTRPARTGSRSRKAVPSQLRHGARVSVAPGPGVGRPIRRIVRVDDRPWPRASASGSLPATGPSPLSSSRPGRRGRGTAVERGPRAGAVSADVRLGDVRRRRVEPRHHGPDHLADRPRDQPASGRPPHVCGTHPAGAGPDPHRVRRRAACTT